MEYGLKMKKLINQFSERMFAPTDVASVVLFRVGFGLLMFWEVTRYFYFGWVEELFAKPQFHSCWFWAVDVLGSHALFISAGLRNSSQNRSFIFNMSISAGWFQSRRMLCTCFLLVWECWR